MSHRARLGFAAALALLAAPARADGPVHVTYLWHLDQPIYWPAPNASGTRYQTAADSLAAKASGAVHPENDLIEIFGKDDRVAVYQHRVRDAVGAMKGYPHGGAQLTYSGGLIENIASLGATGQLGYTSGWADPLREARAWKTTADNPRLDIVQFAFHHALLPLVDHEVARMEIALYQHAYAPTWGGTSRGLFPSEMAFAEHLIPVLAKAGINWVIVSNSHISRASAGYPYVEGSGGDNIPPPNAADVQNQAQAYYNRIKIDRGVSPANAVPFAYLPHRARYVDPDTGAESRIIVVPAAQSESWQDGYACFGSGPLDALAEHQDPTRPMLLLLAHDGDNAFGGGYSYYHECTPTFLGDAAAKGHVPTTVEDYLSAYPPPLDDVVHVESGAWVNADGDFGAPTFLNWNWPLVGSDGAVDLEKGWAEDERSWAVITAATNHVLTATAAAGEPDLERVLHPEKGASQVERAWHYLLGSLNSGYMYYGKVLDMELKPVIACNEAVKAANGAAGSKDTVPPTIWLPQRWPDNPGGVNFGPLYGYKKVIGPSDFQVWTFVHDVSGVDAVTLHVRADDDGKIGVLDTENHTYAGGKGVGAWKAIPMKKRAFPKGNYWNDPDIDVSTLPVEIADEYYATVSGYVETMLDYYVEAVDQKGQKARSPIQHVYVGQKEGTVAPPSSGVAWLPERPNQASTIVISSPAAGTLHWGVNGWSEPAAVSVPQGSQEAGDGKAVDTKLAGPDADGRYFASIGPFVGGPAVRVVDFAIQRTDGSWDNNGGSDYHITVDSGVLGTGGASGGEGDEDDGGCGVSPKPRTAGGLGALWLGALAVLLSRWRLRPHTPHPR